MKSILHKLSIAGAMLCALSLCTFVSCQRQEIVFPIEEHQFAEKAGYILIEVIAPNETATGKDILYITGPFSGGKLLELTAAEYMDYKYGIYLDPATFVGGKSLADGYQFRSKLSGLEMSSRTDTVHHYENAETGGRLDISLVHWEMFYNDHNGYVVYVENNSTWKDMALYAWSNDGPEILGSWPGITATGTETIDGIEYIYFDLQSENTGKTYNLILNDNQTDGNQKDAISNFEITRDIYFDLSDDACKEKGVAAGYKLYVLNHTGWLEMSLYVWGDGEYMGGWPGSKPLRSTVEVAGNNYLVYEFPVTANGKNVNLIFNDGNNEKTKPESIALKLDKSYYVQVVVDGGPKIIDPEGEIIKPDLPEGNMVIRANKPDAWENLYIYSSGFTNDWPGSLMESEGDGNYRFELPRGASFVFNSAPIGNQTSTIQGIKDDTCFQIENNGTYQKTDCE